MLEAVSDANNLRFTAVMMLPYDRRSTIRDFALMVELLRESDAAIDLVNLDEYEAEALAHFDSIPDFTFFGDVLDPSDPRVFFIEVGQRLQRVNPSNMGGRLRLPEQELVQILRRCKGTGSSAWHREYLREVEDVANQRDFSRIQRWNARHPTHAVG